MIDRAQAQLFLVGFMGAGKSTVAERISARTGLPWVDVDAAIEERTGRPIADWLCSDTEAEFRRIERQLLQGLGKTPRVVAVGGGAFLSAVNREWMRRTGVTVWLDAKLEELRERTRGGKGRPLWNEADPLAFRALFERRRAAYALADIRVDTSGKSPENVSIEICERFEGFF